MCVQSTDKSLWPLRRFSLNKGPFGSIKIVERNITTLSRKNASRWSKIIHWAQLWTG